MSSSVSRKPTQVKSALRTLDVIEFVVARDGGVQAQEVASALAIPLSSMSYLLSTLCDREYLVREGRRYMPGPGLQRLRIPEKSLPIEIHLAPIIHSARLELNETVSLFGIDGWEAVVLLTEASHQSLRYAIDPGVRRPLHALAGGRALLATLDSAKLDRYFRESHRERFTDRTVVDETALRAELDKVRAIGFAEVCDESQFGICGLARMIDLKDKPAVAIGIAVPTVRFTEDLRDRARAVLGRIRLG